MNIYEAVGPRSLAELLSEIHSGQMVLPDFQRDFVWEAAATAGLLVSIANEHPAGSILRVRDGQRAFATRPIENAPLVNHLHTFLVLDGQQRLTSLYQALFGVGEHRFFIDLANAFENPSLDGDGAVFFERASKRGIAELESDIGLQAERGVLPLSVFHRRSGGYWKWVADMRSQLDPDKADEFDTQARNLYTETLRNFENYAFPVVTLRDTVTPAALCTIFETINMTGVRLTVFELLTARLWRHGINMREKWDSAVEEFPVLDDFRVDPYSALQALALVRHDSCQKRVVLDLTPEDINESWDKVIQGMAKAFEILRDDCGVMTRTWLPTPSMIAPLTAVIVAGESRGAGVGARRAQIKRWIWCAMLGRRFEAAANTRAEKDFKEMKEWFGGGPLPDTIESFRFDRETLWEASSKSSAIYKSIICLALSSEPRARDFHKDSVITQEMLATNEVDDHHVFPRAFLKNEMGITNKKLIDCVLNRTLIDRTTNQMISSRSPSVYLAELDKNVDTDRILGSHLIPSGPSSPLRSNDFEVYLQRRADLLCSAISVVTEG